MEWPFTAFLNQKNYLNSKYSEEMLRLSCLCFSVIVANLLYLRIFSFDYYIRSVIYEVSEFLIFCLLIGLIVFLAKTISKSIEYNLFNPINYLIINMNTFTAEHSLTYFGVLKQDGIFIVENKIITALGREYIKILEISAILTFALYLAFLTAVFYFSRKVKRVSITEEKAK